ncbi:unnamed protein product [Discula destructiva]
MSEKIFNVSVIGYGLSAKVFHLPFIGMVPNLRLHSIVQRNPVQGNSATEDFPSAKHFDSVNSMLQEPEVDLVIVAIPPQTHFEVTRDIINSGKHALVEKPFVPSSAQAEELIKLAKEKGVFICVFQNRRWDADFLTVQKLLQEDTLGRVYELDTHYDRFRPNKPTNWKAITTLDDGNGAIYDLGTHLIDQVYVLFGTPTEVYAKFVQQRTGTLVSGDGGPENQPDSVNVVLSYADKGLLVHVRIGVMSVASEQRRFWIRGTKGSYHKLGLDPQEAQLVSGMQVGDQGFGVDGAAYNGRLELLQEDGSVHGFTYPNVEPQTYLRFYELLAKALSENNEESLPVPARQALEVLQIIEAVRKSARSGMEVTVRQ